MLKFDNAKYKLIKCWNSRTISYISMIIMFTKIVYLYSPVEQSRWTTTTEITMASVALYILS